MAYRTRSDTLKLQRLIEVLKERGSESAASALEGAATDFLNDVKPKYKPGEIPFYDGTESDDGSSYVEGADDDNGTDAEEEWEDCIEDLPRPPTPPREPVVVEEPIEVKEPSPAREPTPQKEPSVVKEPTPQRELPQPAEPSPIPVPKKEPKVESNKCYMPAVLLSGVERSSDIASPLMKFPTLPVSIPNLFGSNPSSANATSKKTTGNKERKKVPEDAVGAVLADSMTVAAAVVLPNEPTFSQISSSKKEALKLSGDEVIVPQSEKETTINLELQSQLLSDGKKNGSSLEKAPKPSIAKVKIQTEKADLCIIPEEPLLFATDFEFKLDVKQAIIFEEAFVFQEADIIESPIVAKMPSPSPPKEVIVNEPKPAPLLENSNRDKEPSCKSVDHSDSNHVSSSSPVKPVILQIPDHGSLKPSRSPGPSRKVQKPVVVQAPSLQYNVPDDVKIPKVGGQRSRKPTLASQWRKQKEKQKQIEQEMQDRLDTFSDNWPYPEGDASVPSVSALAEAGFFFLGLNDCVQCSVCQSVLSGWNVMISSDSDPWIQHVRASPGCTFLEKTKGQAWINEQLKIHE